MAHPLPRVRPPLPSLKKPNPGSGRTSGCYTTSKAQRSRPSPGAQQVSLVTQVPRPQSSSAARQLDALDECWPDVDREPDIEEGPEIEVGPEIELLLVDELTLDL